MFDFWFEGLYKSKKSEKKKEEIIELINELHTKYCNLDLHKETLLDYARKEANFFMVYIPDLIEARGFIIATVDFNLKKAYLAYICADRGQGYGTKLIDRFHSFLPGFTFSLHALIQVVNYYPKFGYNLRKDCNHEVVSSEEIVGLKFPGYKKLKLKSSKPYRDLIEKLQEHGLNSRKEGNCKNMNLKANEIIKGECFIDGYTMFKCKNKKSKKLDINLFE